MNFNGWMCAVAMGLVLMLTACSPQGPVAYTGPDQRESLQSDKPWPHNSFVVIGWHDVEDEAADQRFLSVRTSALREQLAWLKAEGYQAVSVDQVLEAHRGGKALPPKAVMLTFDDGFRSFYTRVFPLLTAYNWPAVWAPVGKWIDTPAGQRVDYGGITVERSRFASWDEIRQLSRSPLVEVGAHTDNSHFGIVANPQGSMQPAIATRGWDSETQRYETEAEYTHRVRQDVSRITQKIRRATGQPPKAWVWPYGAASGTALREVKNQGYEMVFTLESGLANASNLDAIPRILISDNPSLANFAQQVISVQEPARLRVMHIDLDYVYDENPQQLARNLDVLIQRVKDMQINTVFLQAFADTKGDGLVKEVYFPNRWLPVRADLFNRVSWQLANRAEVNVYAWMPVLSWDTGHHRSRVLAFNSKTGVVSQDRKQYSRLSVFNAENREMIKDIYRDLSGHAAFRGILFHDDALMSDFEDASADALAAYQKAGFPDDIAAIRANPEQFARWTQFKSQALTDFTIELSDVVREVRGPQVKTARNIFAMPVLNPESEAWFAQSFPSFVATYDWTAVMAMPLMEGVSVKESNAWLEKLVHEVNRIPGAKAKTLYELQALDWRPDGQHRPIDDALLAGWMSVLQLNGVTHYGYYPDDFINDQPAIKVIRPELSQAWYPNDEK
ncbi:poly-beta-1,6-N-acetyl-D-glucosamine N-deacetylase [Citrobacter sp. NCU1]|uniref:poly-beta-1,6-N-acetyl-D-glucosamine N-deacetylase PgaB n=1 Tax=Citrobacter sp. NCU1 TaxID=2026683 RepID=UPI00139112D8|nr:poly-beta-1,6-N-acetyl-D-glucosamine N-deacetylase PgaB [Citrobacter sp. NCU1]NDO83684.1 poly-beta-1,6-N-acetyl-D-glucosamine N-deacetylase [Citrobacter sp. NCU1]